jgi:hypothetical protein
MNIREYGVLFWTVVGIITLLIASPALSRLLVYPQTEFFTEMGLLGPHHTAEGYPFNITRGQIYNIYLNLTNHLGYFAYYVVEVKFRNDTQSMPSSFGPIKSRTPSSLPSLYNVSAFVPDAQSWELPVRFSFDYAYDSMSSVVDFYNMTFNGAVLNMSSYVAAWNSTTRQVFGSMFFEAWIYNSTTRVFQYHDRFVGLVFNMAVS